MTNKLIVTRDGRAEINLKQNFVSTSDHEYLKEIERKLYTENFLRGFDAALMIFIEAALSDEATFELKSLLMQATEYLNETT